ncbi:hypothetical protein SAMN05421796_11065 [Chryseobacterium piscicola]|uniref:Phage late control gene D protein (GPD) n=2 Tax=Chryseobacterium piscicola TaxID=551459 RepID=A0A1N7P1B1_9FLAO|nr:hypothetical protein B0A70_10220 [Chryseobacterium piscicola]SIT04336.1 hypothetical protein SAMN05421796_11065 [Chryseobacterium piscicola]
MLYQMSHFVEITDSKGYYIPNPPITEINIERNIKNLADFATVTCVIFDHNQHIKFKENESFDDDGSSERKIYKLYKRGQKIKIHLGYDNNLKLEFVGYIKDVKTDEGKMVLDCEDELFMFRKKVKNKVFGTSNVKSILQHIVKEINPKIKIVCDYDMSYEKFTIYKADAIDVLKQLQQDTGADVYFRSSESEKIGQNSNIADMYGGNLIDTINTAIGLPAMFTELYKKNNAETTELHFRMPYMKKNTDPVSVCDYSMQHNVEDSQLNYRNTTDLKVKIRIVTHSKSGERLEVEFGQPGGEEFEYKVNRISNAEMKKRAEMEWDRKMAPGYDGSFTTWLIPYVEPNYSVGIYDEDFPEKDGIYNVESVVTRYSEEGGQRTVTPGIKLSANNK